MMTEANWVTTAISSFTAVLALVALVTSRRTARALYQLQLQSSQEKSHLKAVEILHRDKRKRLGFGFKVLNGPDEVTMSDASISLIYKVYKEVAFIRHDVLFRLMVRSDEFGVLGITGEPFSFRLLPNDEKDWRFPFSVTYYLPEIESEDDNRTFRGRKVPVIELTFNVTASGNVKGSEPIKLGNHRSGKTLLGFFEYNMTGRTLKDIILGGLARDVLQSSSESDPVIRDELKDIARRGTVIPAELLKWLVDTWEEVGSFGDESTETLARALLTLRPPSPDPELVVRTALSDEPSAKQSLPE